MLKSAFLFMALLAAAHAQPAFEVATVKVAPGQWRESKVLTDRIDFGSVSLKYCIAFAYRVKEYQVSGPPWIGELRFEIIAKGPAGTQREQLPDMVQTLLRDRFKLEVHREKKDYNVFALIVGKGGPKLTETPKDTPAPDGAAYGISTSTNGIGRLEARHADMASLVNTLPRFVGRPVVDLTGISGRYDFDLEFSPEEMRGVAMPNTTEFSTSIFSSIQRIGLKLDPQKLPLDTIVIDRAEKVATEN